MSRRHVRALSRLARWASEGAPLETYLALGMLLHAMRLAKRAGSGVDDPNIGPEELTREHGDAPESVPTRARPELEQVRAALMRGDPGAGRTLRRLVEAHPDSLAARNLCINENARDRTDVNDLPRL